MATGGGRIIAERKGAVGTITIDNPDRHNAISNPMWQAITDAALAFDVAAGFQRDHVANDQHVFAFRNQHWRFWMFHPEPMSGVMRQNSKPARLQNGRRSLPQISTGHTGFEQRGSCI